jgi:CRISPR-associated protein Csm4
LKCYEIIIKPLSGFGTPLKGDTIFGHICWQAAYDTNLFGNSLDVLLLNYTSTPFLVLSSAHIILRNKDGVKRIFKRPDMPLSYLFGIEGQNKKEAIEKRKNLKAKKWMLLSAPDRIESLRTINYLSDNEILGLQKETKRDAYSIAKDFTQPHNTINRLTGTTGEGRFTPFVSEQKVYYPSIELSLFVGIAENIQIGQVIDALKKIGTLGYGKDASTGLGKFTVEEDALEINLSTIGCDSPNACYTLAPSVPEKDRFKEMYFTPFTRFGRHGDILAKSSNPFKNPVIMADEGAILVPKDIQDVLKYPYIGTGVTGISKTEPNTIMQGYSLYIPVRVEV